MSYVFKICVNMRSEDEILDLMAQLDDHLCLGKILRDKLGLCLGVVSYTIDGEVVKLSIWTVNDEMRRPWIRFGGHEIDYARSGFRNILFQKAKELKKASAM